MSLVTFVRDYIHDPDRIIHTPNFVFDLCKDFIFYICSFQWLRNLTFVNLSVLPSSLTRLQEGNGIVDLLGQQQTFSFAPFVSSSTSWFPSFLLNQGHAFPFGLGSQVVFYGLANGVVSTLHCSILTIVIAHVALQQSSSPLYEIKSTVGTAGSTAGSTAGEAPFSFYPFGVRDRKAQQREISPAFQIALASCVGDLFYLFFVLVGFSWVSFVNQSLLASWLSLEPLPYVLGFLLQLLFTLEIIRNNRTRKSGLPFARALKSQKPWFLPAIALFSWCDQTQFFQTLSGSANQPTASPLDLPFLGQEAQGLAYFVPIGIYLLAFAFAKILFTALGLTLFQKIKDNIASKSISFHVQDTLAIGAVTCSLACLPSYNANFLVSKALGFLPDELRAQHSLFSPWDMPSKVFSSDMDFVSNDQNLSEYPFFLPFYDKGEYGGWKNTTEEDVRYLPLRLWQTRRGRAPWRRTTLQEPALTFTNDNSLFVNPGQAKAPAKSIRPGLSLQPPKDLYTFDKTLNKQNKDVNNPHARLMTAFYSNVPLAQRDSVSLGKTKQTISKNGQKRLMERLKKPLRRTSSLFHSTKGIKENKRLHNRLKRFKRYLRPLDITTRGYKKPKIKFGFMNHFRYLKNKKKKIRKSRRLFAKLYRQHPHIDDLNERKSAMFPVGIRVPPAQSNGEALSFTGEAMGTTGVPGVPNLKNKEGESGVTGKNLYENASYTASYPKKKDRLNIFQDFRLSFRPQLGENLEFAQEEIRARIYTNPYMRFLLNRKIDSVVNHQGSKNKNLNESQEKKIFQRRLLISKYADAVRFLGPSWLVSSQQKSTFMDRPYNHQFKGTLSTVRRLFSLKVQYDQSLVYPLGSEPNFSHEDLQNGKNEKPKGPQQPMYAAWDPVSRKLVLTNRFFDFQTGASFPPSEPDAGTWMTGKQGSSRLSSGSPLERTGTPAPAGQPGSRSRLIDAPSKGNGDGEPLDKEKHFTSWPLREGFFTDNELVLSELYSNSQPLDSLLSQECEKARPGSIPRRVTSSSRIWYPPTLSQLSQKIFGVEKNDRKTFLFKHNTNFSSVLPSSKVIGDNYQVPASAEQRKTSYLDKLEHPLWTILRNVPPNQGGFVWPGNSM